MTLQEMADDLRKKAARLKRAVFSGRYHRKHLTQMENWEREQLPLALSDAAESLARCADKLKALHEERGVAVE